MVCGEAASTPFQDMQQYRTDPTHSLYIFCAACTQRVCRKCIKHRGSFELSEQSMY